MSLNCKETIICKFCYVLIIALYLELLLWCFKHCSLVCPSVISALRRFWPSRPCCQWTTPSSTAQRTKWFMPTTLEWTSWYQEEITWCCSMYIHRCVYVCTWKYRSKQLSVWGFVHFYSPAGANKNYLLLSEYSSHLAWLPYGRFAAVEQVMQACADVCVYM